MFWASDKMREKERIHRICIKLEELWLKSPDQRLGQLLENYLFTKGKRGDMTSVRLFYQDDDETECILDEMLKE